ncbi:helix-turn-helix transcriptional regulator [Roseobacteraceae bacterium NS-SX3]
MIEIRKLTGRPPARLIDSGYVADLACRIGTGGFVGALLKMGAQTVEADFVSIFCLGDRDVPFLVGTNTRTDPHRARLAAENYQRHWQADRNAELLLARNNPGDFLTIQQAADVESFAYQRDCYTRPGIADRISMIRRRKSYALSVSLYRSAEHGAFPGALQNDVAAVLNVMLAMTERHMAFSLKGDVWHGKDIQARLALTYPDLTDREREVAALAIKGRTASEIAGILGIAETTVITHRRRAYKRMNVSSLRQLLSS